ncbi:MAG: WG repeat-containing protein [Clostridia bacterium]|nr:WG repeat-containing protein [Clostridia bacterium]
MSRGKRFDEEEKKLNMKKVAAVVIALLVIIMFIVGIKELFSEKSNTNEKVFAIGYYTVYEDGKWGVIDTKGNTVIKPTYNDMIVVPENSKPVFFVLENVNYDDETYDTKVVNEKNEPIFTSYDKVELLYNHDENNNIWYENAIKVKKDGKYGLINFDGKETLSCSKDSIDVLDGTKSVYITSNDGQKGIVNNLGKEIISNKYVTIAPLTEKYENGFIVKNESGKFGLINYDGTVALEEKYDEIKHIYGNKMYVVVEAGTLKLVNTKGEDVITEGFNDIKSIDGDYITILKDGKYGVVSKDNTEKIPAEYDNLTYAFGDYYIAKRDGKYGIITINNSERVGFNYTFIKYLEDAGFIQANKDNMQSELMDKDFAVKATGIVAQINTDKNYIRLRVNDEYKYYNFKLEEKENTEILNTNTIFLSKKDGKYGYVNEKGIVVVDYIYEDATEQNKYGFVAVKKNGKWGCLDSKGKVVVEPTYTLDNAIIVDFIAQWHLATDINANYYTK